jgi:transposase
MTTVVTVACGKDAMQNPPCHHCQQLETQLAELQAKFAKLEEDLARAKKNSTTSSKPPSSDIVKPPKRGAGKGKKRRRGGQPGHAMRERQPFAADQVTPRDHLLELCPTCGHGLTAHETAPRVVQQMDIQDVPVVVIEHRSQPFWCDHCQCVHFAPLPLDVQRGGLVGPRLTSLIAYMKGACHASYSTIRKYLRDVLHIQISRGLLGKVIDKVSESLSPAYEELFRELPNQAHLNVDETGHKNNGDLMWTWCFRASLYTLFKIDPSRGSQVLIDVLGKEFDGVLGCDYFSAYRRYHREFGVALQFCLAHLIRDVKFITTLTDRHERRYGERVKAALRKLFGVIHRRDEMSGEEFQAALAAAREEVVRCATENVPQGKHARNLAKRFEKHGDSYFRFITTPGIEPTNNLAEQAIRFVVIDRHITQGTRSEKGQKWCERIWTVIATCTQQGRSVFAYLEAAVTAWFFGKPSPSLLSGTNP